MAAAAVRDDELRVDPEGRHHVHAIEVQVREVGEVACVVDGDGVRPLAARVAMSCSGVVAAMAFGG